jgi:hypothetical protein
MFDDIFAELSNLQNNFSESVQDTFGISVVNDIIEPIRHETNALVLMHEELEHSLANLESMREAIRVIRTRQ